MLTESNHSFQSTWTIEIVLTDFYKMILTSWKVDLEIEELRVNMKKTKFMFSG